ncbi:Acetyltransferase [Candidatus Desulfarcum epimagneticum]|uniref:Acetyltransferase n=1 Tax=uncultured Desulfobacteraceae bacterium TaxID=218296 RepID=A0A484HJ88_9BACT|nr:Acetyltransferase [uncultured Desulfobacteraceae bacterium]
MIKKIEIILIGGGGHCKSCIDVIEQDGGFSIAGIVDLPENIEKKVLGYPVIACDDELASLRKRYNHFAVTVGYIRSPDLRFNLYQRVKELNASLPVIISPHAYVSRHSQIGEGTMVFHNAVVNAGAKIGVNNIINSCCLIEHDAVVGDHCHISTGAIVNGGTQIGDKAFCGSGSVSKEYISIPGKTFVKAHSIIK